MSSKHLFTVILATASLGTLLIAGCRREAGSETAEPATESLERVREACSLIAEATWSAIRSRPEVSVVEGGPDGETPRCSLGLELDIASVAPGAEPTEAIRSAFRGSSWVEDLSRAADGPGGSGYGFEREGVYCEVMSGRPASLVDGEIREDGFVFVDAVCRAVE